MTRSFYKAVRQAYYNVIKNLSYGSGTLKIYDYWAEDDADPPYVIIDSMTSADRGEKCRKTNDFTITIQIVTFFRGQGGRATADDIADLILGSLSSVKNNVALSSNNFALHGIDKISDVTLNQQSGTTKIYRRVLTFGHIVEQLN